MDLNSQETPKTEQQEVSPTPSPISEQQQQDSPAAPSQEEVKVEEGVKELTPIKAEKTTTKKKKEKEPQVIKDGTNHITIK